MILKKQEKEKVREIISNELLIDISSVKDDSNFYFDLGGDSFDEAIVYMEIESYFGVSFLKDIEKENILVKDFYELLSNELN